MCSNTGSAHGAGDVVAKDAQLVELVDAWTWHCVGCNSDAQLGPNSSSANQLRTRPARANGFIAPGHNNEFEYLDDTTSPERCINTAQSIMNWFLLGAPTWYWLHALKPTTNAESAGYGVGPHSLPFPVYHGHHHKTQNTRHT